MSLRKDEGVLREGSLGSIKILPKHRPHMSSLAVSVVGHEKCCIFNPADNLIAFFPVTYLHIFP